MVGVNSAGISADDADILAKTRAGSVILLGNSTAGAVAVKRVVGHVRDATRRPHGVKTMLAADQEGGLVQRLKGRGFVTIPAAVDQREQSDRQLKHECAALGPGAEGGRNRRQSRPGRRCGPGRHGAHQRADRPAPARLRQLARGRRRPRSPPSSRAWTAAGIITATKHFPGLGRVRGNTDYVRRVVDATTVRHDPALAGFESAVESGVDMVMMSSAYYSRIDADHRAAFSTKIIAKMVRGDLDFTGVVDLRRPRRGRDE